MENNNFCDLNAFEYDNCDYSLEEHDVDKYFTADEKRFNNRRRIEHIFETRQLRNIIRSTRDL